MLINVQEVTVFKLLIDNGTSSTESTFPQDDFGDPRRRAFRVVDFIAVQEHDAVGVLLDRTGVAEV